MPCGHPSRSNKRGARVVPAVFSVSAWGCFLCVLLCCLCCVLLAGCRSGSVLVLGLVLLRFCCCFVPGVGSGVVVADVVAGSVRLAGVLRGRVLCVFSCRLLVCGCRPLLLLLCSRSGLRLCLVAGRWLLFLVVEVCLPRRVSGGVFFIATVKSH